MRHLLGYLAAFEFDFVPFALPADRGVFVFGLPDHDRCRSTGAGVVTCEYRITNSDVLEALEDAPDVPFGAEGRVEVTVNGAITGFTLPVHVAVGTLLAEHAVDTVLGRYNEHCGAATYEGIDIGFIGEVPATALCAELLVDLFRDYLRG